MRDFVETPYEPSVRRRNRVAIATLTAVGCAVLVFLGATTSWPIGNAFGTSAIVIGFGTAFWWMFGSKKAGSIRIAPDLGARLKKTFHIR